LLSIEETRLRIERAVGDSAFVSFDIFANEIDVKICECLMS
jgi:hypothetical protein